MWQLKIYINLMKAVSNFFKTISASGGAVIANKTLIILGVFKE